MLRAHFRHSCAATNPASFVSCATITDSGYEFSAPVSAVLSTDVPASASGWNVPSQLFHHVVTTSVPVARSAAVSM